VTALVLTIAAAFAAMGLAALARPDGIVAFFGTPALTRDGRNEVRAVYGGFGLAVAALLAAAPSHAGIGAGALLAVAVALFGMAGGRIASMLIDGAPGRWPWVFMLIELAGGGALLAAGAGHAA
jgi:hypothetical protein